MAKPKQQEEIERPAWVDDERLDILEPLDDYYRARQAELREVLVNGEQLDTGDPYLMGWSRGVLAGLDLGRDFLSAYSQYARHEIFWPDRHPSRL